MNRGNTRPTSTIPMIARSSELTVVSTPAARISGPVAPKNVRLESVASNALTSAAPWASPDGSPATIINLRTVVIVTLDTISRFSGFNGFRASIHAPYEARPPGNPVPLTRLPGGIGSANEPGRSESRESDDRHTQRQSTPHRSTSATSSGDARRCAGCRYGWDYRHVGSAEWFGTRERARCGLWRKRRHPHRHLSSSGGQSDRLRCRESRCRWRQRRFRSGRHAANHRLARGVELSHQDRILRKLNRVHKPNTGRHAYLFHCGSRREDQSRHDCGDQRAGHCLWRRRSEVEFSHEQGNDQDGRSSLHSFVDDAFEEYSSLFLAVRISLDQATRSRFGIFDTDFRWFRCEGCALVHCLLSNTWSLRRFHLSQRHLHGARTRLRWRIAHTRELAIVSRSGFLHGQRSHLWTRSRCRTSGSGWLEFFRRRRALLQERFHRRGWREHHVEPRVPPGFLWQDSRCNLSRRDFAGFC